MFEDTAYFIPKLFQPYSFGVLKEEQQKDAKIQILMRALSIQNQGVC